MKARHALHHEPSVIAETVVSLIQAVGNDEARNHKEHFDSEPAVIAGVLEGSALAIGEVVPADSERG